MNGKAEVCITNRILELIKKELMTYDFRELARILIDIEDTLEAIRKKAEEAQ